MPGPKNSETLGDLVVQLTGVGSGDTLSGLVAVALADRRDESDGGRAWRSE